MATGKHVADPLARLPSTPKHSNWTKFWHVHAPLPPHISMPDGRELHDAGRRKTNRNRHQSASSIA
jgi:hypothetical protein